MIGVDVSQCQDGSFMMDQKACMDNIDPAGIKPERWNTPEASCDRTRKIHTARSPWSHAMTVHTDGCKNSMCRVNVTIFTYSGYSRHVDGIQSKTQGDDVKILWNYECTHIAERSWLWWSDAAWANRKDLSSTLGFFSGVTTKRILQGKRHGVTPDSSSWKIETKSKIEFERRGAGF